MRISRVLEKIQLPTIPLEDAGLECCRGLLLHDFLYKSAKLYPAKEAMVDDTCRMTYAQFNNISNSLAHGLTKLGVGHGDRVAMLIENSVDFGLIFAAIIKIGAVVVPLFPRLVKQDLKYILDHAAVKAVFLEEKALAEISPLWKELSANLFIVRGQQLPTWSFSLTELKHDDISNLAVDLDPEEPAVIQYTSGTTGKPKGVVLSHRALVVNAHQVQIFCNIAQEEKLHVFTALYHVSAAGMMWLSVFLGCTAFITTYHTVPVLRQIEQERITGFVVVPAMLNMIMHEMELHRYDLSSIRWMMIGAAVLPFETMKKLRALFPQARLLNMYGLTENAPTVTGLEDRYALIKQGSVGKPLPSSRARVVDEKGMDCAPSQVGELILQGASFMSGYFREPERLASVVKDGWYYTRDLSYRDEEGFLYIVDRKDDMIIRGGENIYPAEIEAGIYRHPKVLEAAVIGIADKVMGQEIKVFIVPKEDSGLTVEEISGYCRSIFPSLKCPKYFELCQALPKISTGMKTSKVLLRQKEERNF